MTRFKYLNYDTNTVSWDTVDVLYPRKSLHDFQIILSVSICHQPIYKIETDCQPINIMSSSKSTKPVEKGNNIKEVLVKIELAMALSNKNTKPVEKGKNIKDTTKPVEKGKLT